MRKSLRWGALVGAAVLVACGEDEGGGRYGLADSVHSFRLSAAAQVGGYYTDFGVGRMTGYLPLVLFPPLSKGPFQAAGIAEELRRAAFAGRTPEGCTLIAWGGFVGPDVDQDRDGIPEDAYVKLECTITDSIAEPGVRTTTYYQVEAKLTEHPADLRGYDFSDLYVERRARNGVNTWEHRILQEEKITVLPSGGEYSLRRSEESRDGGYSPAYEAWDELALTVRLDPDAPITSAPFLPDGEVSVDGWWESVYTTERDVTRFTIETTVPIRLLGSCTGGGAYLPFTSGQTKALLVGREDEVWGTSTFVDCGVQPETVIFGAYDQ